MAGSSKAIIDAALRDRVFPGIVMRAEKSRRIRASYCGGTRRQEPAAAMSEETLFDLASLTKPLATTPSALALCAAESIPLDAQAGRFLPELNPAAAGITLEQLMTHSSGLPPVPDIFPLFPTEGAIRREQALAHLYSLAPVTPPGRAIEYSCTGYILLTQIIQRISARTLPELFRELILEPAGIHGLTFNPPAALQRKAAATEFCSWRRRRLIGEVHDENCFCLGGAAGNAGLFGSAGAVSRIADLFIQRGFLNGREVVPEELIARMTACQRPDLAPRRALGFLTQDTDSFAGPGYSPRSYGHTGFTGTSLWIDPDRDLKIVVLTNRVYYGRARTADKIKTFRRALHQALLRELA